MSVLLCGGKSGSIWAQISRHLDTGIPWHSFSTFIIPQNVRICNTFRKIRPSKTHEIDYNAKCIFGQKNDKILPRSRHFVYRVFILNLHFFGPISSLCIAFPCHLYPFGLLLLRSVLKCSPFRFQKADGKPMKILLNLPRFSRALVRCYYIAQLAGSTRPAAPRFSPRT